MPGFLQMFVFILLKIYDCFICRKLVSLQVQIPQNVIKYKKSKSRAFFSASLTLEASMAVVLFLVGSSALIYPVYFLGLQGQIQAAMEEIGEELASAEAGSQYNAGNNLSHIYVKKRVIGMIGKDKLDSSFLYNGSEGISFSESSFLKGLPDVDLIARYEIQIPLPLLNLKRISIVQRTKKRAWIGREMKEIYDGQAHMVYITAYGTVYHISLSCKHLNTKIIHADYEVLQDLRNGNGGIYYPCEFCKPKSGGNEYFLTRYGNRYHDEFACRGLRVTIKGVLLSETGLPPCKDCGRGGIR